MFLAFYEVMYDHQLQPIMVYSEEESDGTPLACAASMGHEEIVSYLLGQDVQVNGKGGVCYYGI